MKRLLLALCFFIGLQQTALAASCSSYPFTLQNNTTADATQVMADFNTVRNCVINNAAGSGVNTDITSITGLSTPLSNAQGGTAVYIGGTSGGSANAQTVATVTPIGFALTNGWRVTFLAGFTNTGATQINVNSTGLTDVKKLGHAGLEALIGGEIVTGNVIEAIYDGTEFVLLSSPFSDVGTATAITAASTTDLGTISTHNVLINGTTSITAFGSTASATEPIYLLKFSGALTLTYNASSLLIPGAGNITTAANDTAVVEYLGSGNWQVLSYTRYSGAGIVAVTPLCGTTGFTVANNAVVPTAKADYTATTAVMLSTSNVPITASAISGTIDATTTGANALDAGSLGSSSWYYIYLINNGTTTAGLMSLSATAPTMPSGYIYKCLLNAYITDSSNHFRNVSIRGNVGQYTTAVRNIANGTAGTWSASSPSWATVSYVGTYVPTGAIETTIILLNKYNGSSVSDVILAPNGSYSGSSSLFSPPCAIEQTPAATMACRFMLESTSVFWASDAAGGGINTLNWRMNTNAN